MGHNVSKAINAGRRAKRDGKVKACDTCKRYKWIRHDETECPTCLKQGPVEYAELVKPWERPERSVAAPAPKQTLGDIWREDRMRNHARQLAGAKRQVAAIRLARWVDAHGPHFLVFVWILMGLWLSSY